VGQRKVLLKEGEVNIKSMKKKSPAKNGIKRLQKRESKLVSKGSKAVDEGRNRKADRLLGRAAKVENRMIKKTERRSRSKRK
jgi:hypothetical protein